MEETLMTMDTCFQFITWSYFYHDIIPDKDTSYASYGKFAEQDIARLDHLKESLFISVTAESVYNVCTKLSAARQQHETCPWPQAVLDQRFACESKK